MDPNIFYSEGTPKPSIGTAIDYKDGALQFRYVIPTQWQIYTFAATRLLNFAGIYIYHCTCCKRMSARRLLLLR